MCGFRSFTGKAHSTVVVIYFKFDRKQPGCRL